MHEFLVSIEEKSRRNIPVEEGDYINQEDQGLLYCGKCQTRKQGVYKTAFGELRPYCLCKCAREKRDREEAEQRAVEFAYMVKRNKSVCYPKLERAEMLEKNFQNAEDSKLIQIARNYVENFPEMLKAGKGLMLYGGTGAGKSYAAVCIVNALLDKGYPCLVTNFARLRNEISDTWEGRQDYIDDLNRFSLLVLDDLGAESRSDYMGEIVHSIIDSRCRAALPTIVTTNLTAKQFTSQDDISKSRIYSRLFEMAIPVEVKDADRRRDKMAEEYKKYAKLLGL